VPLKCVRIKVEAEMSSRDKTLWERIFVLSCFRQQETPFLSVCACLLFVGLGEGGMG